MTAKVLVLMIAGEIEDIALQAELAKKQLLALSTNDSASASESSRRKLFIVADSEVPSADFMTHLRREIGSGEPLGVALHETAPKITEWKTAVSKAFKGANIWLFNHDRNGDHIYGAIQEALAAHATTAQGSSSRFDEAHSRLASLLSVDWKLEAKLALLHACLAGDLTDLANVGDVIPDEGPAQRALVGIWDLGSPNVGQRVRSLAGEATTPEGMSRREVKLRELRDYLLPDG